MRTLKKIITSGLVLTLALNTTGAFASTPKINKTKATIYIGETAKLKVIGTKAKVKWSSSNKKIATVNKKGVVKGLKVGSSTIIANVDNKKYKCKITVKKRELTNEALAAYAWVLLENKYPSSNLIISKLQTATDKNWNEKAIVITFFDGQKNNYAYVRLRNGEATHSKYFPVLQLESDDFPNQHLNLNTFYKIEDLEENANIHETLDYKAVKALYKQYLEEDDFIIIT